MEREGLTVIDPEMPAEKSEETPAAPAPPTLLRKMLALLPHLGILAGLAGGAFAVTFFVVRPLFPPLKAGDAKARQASIKFGRVLGLDSIVVNVAQTEGRRYLRATVQLEVPEEEKTVKELEARRPQLVDLLVATLAKKSLAEVTAPEALDRLRGEIYERVIQEVGREKVRRVFITEFVVQ